MILIVDSGSTNAEWAILDSNSIHSYKIKTNGINPYYQSVEEISALINDQFSLRQRSFEKIYFYGAGCNNNDKKSTIEKALLSNFKTNHLVIDSDLMAACHASCGNSPGIVCILGTGSNSCLYDGKNIQQHVAPLGFILGDEGSGANLGKSLISDILKNQLSPSTIELFYRNYNITEAEILENVYKKPFPNRYLAYFTKFLSQYSEIKELENIISQSFNSFIERNLRQYKDLTTQELHFVGSIAFYFQKQLTESLQQNGLTIKSINKSPINGLIKYHSRS